MVCYGFREPIAVFYQLKAACRKRLSHCPPIKVIRVEVKNVIRWLRRFVAFYSGVVGRNVTGERNVFTLLRYQIPVIWQ